MGGDAHSQGDQHGHAEELDGGEEAAAVDAVCDGAGRQADEQPRQAGGERHAGDQAGIVGEPCGKEREGDEREPITHA